MRFEQILELGQDERDRVGEIVVRFFFGSMEHVGLFNTDPHPGNYMLMADGRMAFLDFGNSVRVGERTLELSRRALLAALDGDAERFTTMAADLGYVRDLERIDRELLLRQALLVGDWYLRDRELRIDPDYVAAIVAALVDPRAVEGAFRLVRQLKIPPEEIWLRRVETSVLAVLGQLRARRNWHRIMLEAITGEPATELGRVELSFWGRRGHRPARVDRQGDVL
jgi:hypothetical protein